MKHDDLKRMADKINLSTLEIDYALSVFLALLTYYPIKHYLIFKGGTSIKKTLYPEFRFSTDLDFKAIGEAPVFEGELIQFLQDIPKFNIDDFRFNDFKEDTNVKPPNKKYTISYSFEDEPEGHPSRGKRPRIQIDINRSNTLFEDPEDRKLLLGFYDFKFRLPCTRLEGRVGNYMCKLENLIGRSIVNCNNCIDYIPVKDSARLIRCMSAREILSEKFHALYNPKRTKARDIYDINYLLSQEQTFVSDKQLFDLIKKKIDERDGSFDLKTIEEKIEALRSNWESDITNLVREAPKFDEVKQGILKKMEIMFNNFSR